jgi:cytochrome c553
MAGRIIKLKLMINKRWCRISPLFALVGQFYQGQITMNRILVCSAVFMFALSGFAQAAGDAEAGKTKALACGGCHGMDGNSAVETFPKLAGQNEKYITRQLHALKTSTGRSNDIMLGMAATLGDQDMADVGAYFQTQKISSSAPFDESKLAAGRDLYNGGDLVTGLPACKACHSPTGSGNPGEGFPQLGGQYPSYTIAQLTAFKDGKRTTDDKSLMRDVVAKMSAEDIETVAQYIASLK